MEHLRHLKRLPVRRALGAVVTPVGGVAALRWWWLFGLSSRRSSGCFRRLHSNPRPVMDMSAPPLGVAIYPEPISPKSQMAQLEIFVNFYFYRKNSMRASDLSRPAPLQPNA